MREDIISQIKVIVDRLKNNYSAERVILFGSYAIGEETIDSDVDLLIIAPTKERFFQRMSQVRSLIRDLRNGLPVAPIVLTQEELESRIKIGDQFIEGILNKGISL